MTLMKSVLVMMLVGLTAGTLGCSKSGFTTDKSNTTNENGGLSSPGSHQTIDENIDLTSSISSGAFAGLKAVSLDHANKTILFKIPLGPNIYVTVSNGEIPKYPGLTYTTEFDSSGRAYLTLTVPLKYIMRGVNGAQPAHLPNGDPLPGMPSGEPPGIAFSVDIQKQVKLFIYLGVGAIAAYVETPLDTGLNFTLTVPIKNESQTQVVGFFSVVPPKKEGAHPGGFFLSYKIPPAVAALLDKYVF